MHGHLQYARALDHTKRCSKRTKEVRVSLFVPCLATKALTTIDIRSTSSLLRLKRTATLSSSTSAFITQKSIQNRNVRHFPPYRALFSTNTHYAIRASKASKSNLPVCATGAKADAEAANRAKTARIRAIILVLICNRERQQHRIALQKDPVRRSFGRTERSEFNV
jgi:hypothetical protein